MEFESPRTRPPRRRRRLFELRLSWSAHWSRRPGISPARRVAPVVVSLTSHGKRLGRAHLAVETLFRQTVSPEKIILWVADSLTLADIPLPLRRQGRQGLEIRFVPDVGPHTKGIYAFRHFTDSPVITVDDDTLYPPDLIERLVGAASTEPQHVHCYRAHEIRFAADGRPSPYLSWRMKVDDVSEASFRLFPCGVGGVIYPPGTLHPEVQNQGVFRAICKTEDDVWFKAMALLQGTRAKRLPGPHHEFTGVSGTSRFGLWSNVNSGRNDPQIAAVFEKYDLARRLQSDEQSRGR